MGLLVLNSHSYLSEVLDKIRQKDISRQKISALLLKIRQIWKRRSLRVNIRLNRQIWKRRSLRVNIRLNNSMCSLQLKRELYQYSESKSITHCSERNHHCIHLLRNLDYFPIEFISRNHLISPL